MTTTRSVSSAAPPAQASPSSVEVTASRTEGESFGLCTASVRTLPLRGSEVRQSDLPSVGDNVLFAAKRHPRRDERESVLIDAASGRQLAALGGVYDGDVKLQRAIVSRRGSNVQELLDLQSGGIVRPRITTREGAPQEWRIALDGRSGHVWLLARTKGNRTYFGSWPEPRSAPVALEHTLPFWPSTLDDDSGVLVSDGNQSCLLELERARCFPGQGHGVVLGGRYVVSSEPTIYDAQLQQEIPLGSQCGWRMAATLVEPPRVLLACSVASEVRWAVWSPEGLLTHWTTGEWLRPETSERNSRVVALELLVRPDAIVNHWFDLLRQRVVVTSPLVPLAPQQQFGARILVQSDGEPSGLYVLDVEAATVTPIVARVDCEQLLMWQAESEHEALVACPKPSMAEHFFRPDTRPDHYEWLELIDFRSRRRLRTDKVFEATLTETGIAVGIQPGKVATLAALDWPAECPGGAVP